MLIKVRRPSSVLTFAEWGNKVSFQLLRLFFFFFSAGKVWKQKIKIKDYLFFRANLER